MAEQKQQNKKVIGRLLLLAVAMFGFGYAMVPLYDVFCDITGINGKPRNVAAVYEGVEGDTKRQLTVQFMATVKRGMPWEFTPAVSKLVVHPGEVYETSFFARNLSDKDITGQAIPSIAPGQAALFMNKTECFCFNQQHLKAHEEVEMALRFYIDKDIPDTVKTLTLSYSMFNITEQTQKKNSPAP